MAKGHENLIPFTAEQSREKAKENGRKGGIASGEAKRRYKNLASVLKDYTGFKVTDKEQKQLEALGFTGEQQKLTLFAIPLIRELNKGNIKAYELLLKLLGEDKKLELENRKLKEEIKKLKLEQEKLKDKTGVNMQLEDMSTLADMLKYDSTDEHD